eukprot:TRINITY_DN24638_c0_g1_i1.p1 TRINITY_DN24638_c0_g1~~TRINITY_DN24638_c0_g1_i1.p1  ORF type:complete len:1450 (+),score=516.33 TRINITY_DN24638_c0_g1_i1:269-4351(+)
MQSFVTLMQNLDEAKGMVQGLKEQSLGLRGSMGKYAPNLAAAYKRLQRNKCILHVLRVVKEVAALDQEKAALIEGGEYLRCAHALRTAQVAYEQWPVTRDAAKAEMQLPLLYGQLANLLSPPKLQPFLAAVHTTLSDALLPMAAVRRPGAFAALLHELSDPPRKPGHPGGAPAGPAAAAAAPHGWGVSVASSAAAAPRHELVPLHEGTRLWYNDRPVVTCVPKEFLHAKLVRGARSIRKGVTTTLRVSCKATVYVGVRQGRDGGLLAVLAAARASPLADAWHVAPAVAFKTLGGEGAPHLLDTSPAPSPARKAPGPAGSPAAAEVWSWHRCEVEEGTPLALPCPTAEADGVVVVVAPQAPGPREGKLEECLAALHVMGSVGAVPVGAHQRLIDAMGHITDSTHVRKQLGEYLEAFLKSFGVWWEAERNRSPSGALIDSLLAGLRQGMALSLSGGVMSETDGFSIERRLFTLQQPVLEQLFRVLYRQCEKMMDTTAAVAAGIKQRCAHGYRVQDGVFDAEYATLDEAALQYMADNLWTYKDALPDPAPAAAAQVASEAVKLLDRKSSHHCLLSLIGPRRSDGWLGLTPSRTSLDITVPKIPPGPYGLELSMLGELKALTPDSHAARDGLEKAVGYRVAAMVITPPNGEASTTITASVRDDVATGLAAARACDGAVTFCFGKLQLPAVVGHAAVAEHLRLVCKIAARQHGVTSTDAQDAAQWLTNTMDALLNEYARRQVKTLKLGQTSSAWEVVQSTLSPLLTEACGPLKGTPAGRPAGDTAAFGGGASLSDLLKKSGGDMPRVFDGAPGLDFAFDDVLTADNSGGQHVGLGLSRHIVATPFNAIGLYRPTVEFEERVKTSLGDVSCVLSSMLEATAKRVLLPNLRDYYLLSAREALGYPNPIPLAAGDGQRGVERPPVLEAFVRAAKAMRVWLAVPTALPFARSTVLGDLASMLLYLVERSFSQLKERVQGTLAGAVGTGIADKLFATAARGRGHDGKAGLDKTQEALWKALTSPEHPEPGVAEPGLSSSGSCAGGADHRLVLAANLMGAQAKGKITYMQSSQDLSFVASLVHSAEWLGDQLRVHGESAGDAQGPSGGRQPGVVDDDAQLLAETPCYTSVIPGIPAEGEPGVGLALTSMDSFGSSENIGSFVTNPAPGTGASAELVPPCAARTLPTGALHEVHSKLMLLSRAAFFILQLDLMVRTACLLDCRHASYDHECDTTEPDEFIVSFNRDIRRLDVLYREYLPPPKQMFLTQCYPLAVSYNLIRGVALMKNKHVTEFGVGRLRRNVFALQQNLALLVTDVAQSDEWFVRVRRYYELLTLAPAELTERREQLRAVGVAYTEREFMAAEEVVSRNATS